MALRRFSDEQLRGVVACYDACLPWNLSLIDSHEIRRRMAWLIVSGKLRFCNRWPEKPAAAAGVAQETSPPQGPAASESPRPSSKRVADAPAVASSTPVEAATFTASLDVPAVVRALKAAANSGVPFCEECQKKRSGTLT
jgi:hypothetical protein